ncbi:non-specific lipid transfer protein GPI-anchored 1 [Andrographis paniculata]|uniref:non-specific lipid transfer protein GPI-anchored 1 n=1 Tax=Andrographis paniculata TaxID=175694 RepID=UPI0021E90C40|nr:non-specific lipid transfer protein GPI-anchored 1 [Andrographis paniculata]
MPPFPSSQPPPHSLQFQNPSTAGEMNPLAAAVAAAALLCLGMASAADNSLATKCAAEFQKVTQCLPFATNKAAEPSKQCCDAVAELKNTDPACLCFIIQQIHNGSNEAVKSMGVQEERLLQLPSACKLANASVAECPKLLHLAPNSPDAAIFNNVTAAPTTAAPSGGGGSSAPAKDDGIRLEPQLIGCVVVAAAALLLVGFPGAGAGVI